MKKRSLAFLLTCSLLLASCGITPPNTASAATMHLRKAEGTVGVSDDGGKAVEPREDLGLYSGYGVDTRSASYAWIDLDEVKLTKLDENSEIEITKDGKALEIEVLSGSLFFHVTEPLDDDETMTIRVSSMVVGIRGTCGWVEVPDSDHMNVYLLEGKVRCEAGGETETIRAGEMAEMTVKSEKPIAVKPFYESEVKPFVRDETETTLLESLPEEAPPIEEESVLQEESNLPENGIISGGEWGNITVDHKNVIIYDASIGNIIADSGNVTVYGYASTGNIRTNSGNVIVYGGASIGNIKTDSGNVTAYDVSTGDIETGSGNITVYGRTNTGTITTQSGRIQDTRS